MNIIKRFLAWRERRRKRARFLSALAQYNVSPEEAKGVTDAYMQVWDMANENSRKEASKEASE